MAFGLQLQNGGSERGGGGGVVWKDRRCDRWDELNLRTPAEGEMPRGCGNLEDEHRSLCLFKQHNQLRIVLREMNIHAEDMLTQCEVGLAVGVGSRGGAAGL